MPQSSVPVRTKISVSSRGIARERLDRPHHDEIGRVGGGQAGQHADDRAAIDAGAQFSGGKPARDQRGDDHDAAMREIEHAGDAEDQREADRAERRRAS